MFKAMIIKEFLLVSRDKHALAALFIMPAVFILIMSLALKDVFNDTKSILTLEIQDHDSSLSSANLVDSLEDNSLITINKDSINEPQFILTIAKGFAKDNIKLELAVSPEVSQSVISLLKSQIVKSIMKHKIDAIYNEQQKYVKSTGGKASPPLDFNESNLINIHYLDLDKGEKPTSTQQSVPSWIVFGLFFVIIPMSTIFINERKQNTLLRLSTMNISISALFAGKIIPYMLINQLQVWIMIGVGVFIVPLCGASALKIEGSLLALIAISLSLSLAAIGLSILIATLVDSVEQATTIGGIINILLGAIGGVMVPKFIMPDFMQDFTLISPMSWGLDGYLKLFLRKGTIDDVAFEIFGLCMFGIVSILIAAIFFNKKVKEAS